MIHKDALHERGKAAENLWAHEQENRDIYEFMLAMAAQDRQQPQDTAQ